MRSDGPVLATRSEGRASRYRWLISLALLLLLWQLATWVLPVPAFVLPSPVTTVRAIVADASFLGPHIAMTAAATGAGFLLAIAAGLLFGTAMNASRLARDLLYPPLVLSQAVPLVAIAPLILIWFGFGLLAKVLIIAFICFFPIAVSAFEAFRAVDRGYRELLDTFGARATDRYRHIYLPATLPSILAGMKIAATYSVLGAVIAEWLGGAKGMGVYMTRALNSVRVDRMFGGIVIVVLLSYSLFKAVDILGRLATPWMRRTS